MESLCHCRADAHEKKLGAVNDGIAWTENGSWCVLHQYIFCFVPLRCSLSSSTKASWLKAVAQRGTLDDSSSSISVATDNKNRYAIFCLWIRHLFFVEIIDIRKFKKLTKSILGLIHFRLYRFYLKGSGRRSAKIIHLSAKHQCKSTGFVENLKSFAQYVITKLLVSLHRLLCKSKGCFHNEKK